MDGISALKHFGVLPSESLQGIIAEFCNDLPMAEIEIGVLNRQCLNRRIDSEPVRGQEVATWEARRHEDDIKLHWTFTMAVARAKLRQLYPSIED